MRGEAWYSGLKMAATLRRRVIRSQMREEPQRDAGTWKGEAEAGVTDQSGAPVMFYKSDTARKAIDTRSRRYERRAQAMVQAYIGLRKSRRDTRGLDVN